MCVIYVISTKLYSIASEFHFFQLLGINVSAFDTSHLEESPTSKLLNHYDNGK